MDNIVSLYTTSAGRIGRQQWWIGVIVLAVVNIIISLLILPIFGVSMMPNMAPFMDPNADLAALSEQIANAMRVAGWAGLIQFVIFAYPAYNLMVKRRHDRDNNGLDVLVFMALNVVVLLIQALGIGYTAIEVPSGGGSTISIPTPGILLTTLSTILGIYGLYLLVVLGFLKGTAGPNQYGPDPLGGAVATA